MQEFTIKLTVQQLGIISEALSNAPYRMVAELVANLQAQINAQQGGPVTAEQLNGAAQPEAKPSVN